MLIEEHVYLGTDGIIALSLRLDQALPVHTSNSTDDSLQNTHSHPLTIRCKLFVNAIVGDSQDTTTIIDSNTNSSWFDFTTDPTILAMKLGAATLKPGRHITQIQIYEAASPLGIQWGEIMLVVK
jgi:hypothetical protein